MKSGGVCNHPVLCLNIGNILQKVRNLPTLLREFVGGDFVRGGEGRTPRLPLNDKPHRNCAHGIVGSDFYGKICQQTNTLFVHEVNGGERWSVRKTIF